MFRWSTLEYHVWFIFFRSLLSVLLVSFLGIIFGILTKFSFGRSLLLQYPKFFTLGFVSHEGPSEENMKKSKFSMTFFGQGWSKEEALSEPTDQHTTLPSKKIVTRVSASNPGKFQLMTKFRYFVFVSLKYLFLKFVHFRLWGNCCSSFVISNDHFERESKTSVDWWRLTTRRLFCENWFNFQSNEEWLCFWGYRKLKCHISANEKNKTRRTVWIARAQ